jgi:hypothetical protein
MAVPYTFASATGSIPLSYLDTNFSTPITIGNTAVTLGSTITTAYNMTLGNVIITSVGSTFPNNYLANSNVILGTTTVSLGNTATTLDGLTLANVTVSTGNVTLTKITVTTANVTTANIGTAVITTANVTTANVVTLVVSGNTTLGDATDDTVTVNGYMGVGGAATADRSINILGTSTASNTTQEGIRSAFTANSTATAAVRGFISVPNTQAAAFTVTDVAGFWAANATKGAGSTVTNLHGLYIANQTQGTNNYGITSLVSSGTNKWNIYASGTALNYFAGGVGMGLTAPLTSLHVNYDNAAGLGASLLLSNTNASSATGNSVNIGMSAYTSTVATTNANYRGAVIAAETTVAGNGHDLIFSTNTTSAAPTEKMRITYAGNVGIGTSSPTRLLTLSGSGANTRVQINNTVSGKNFGLYAADDGNSTINYGTSAALIFTESGTERMRIESGGNLQVQAGAVMPYAPAPAAVSAATTLTNANIQGQIISATGTTYTITMPLGTTLETLATWATTNIAYDFFVINTASGIITMAVNTGVTSLGSLTIAIGASAHFRIRRTAANTFVLYRLV